MTTDEMLQVLMIDRTSPKSLKSQLEDQLEKLIENLEAGTPLPPERMISESLQISRVTVRSALNKFYVSGAIIRHGRLGTMVAPKKQCRSIQPNPFIPGMQHEIMHQPPLRFLIYEDLPIQRKFWETVIDNYNNRNGSVTVEPVWMENLSRQNNIREIIQSQKIDIMMLSHLFRLNYEKDFIKIPARLKSVENSDSYILKDLNIDLTYSVPFYLSAPIILWNQELAEKIGISGIPEKVSGGKLLDLLVDSAEKLPDGCLSGVRIWDYLYLQTDLENINDMNRFRPILEKLVQAGRSAGNNIDKLFVTDQKYTFDNLENFLQGRRVFLLGQISHLQVLDPPNFRCGFLTFPSQKNLSVEFLKIAISKNCLNVHAAADFLHYLLSYEVQKPCAEFKGNFPVHKQLFFEHMKNKYHQTKQMTAEFLQNLAPRKDQDKISHCFSDLIIFYLREELKELLYGSMTVDEFIKAMKNKFESLKQRIEIQEKIVV